MKLHTKDIINYRRCPGFAWHAYHDKTSEPFGFYHVDRPFFEYWQEYFNFEDVGQGKVNDTNEDTLSLLKDHDVVFFARVEYMNCRGKIPILIKLDNGSYHAIFPHMSAYPKESEAFEIKMLKWMAKMIGIHIQKYSVLYLNKEYARQEELDIKSLFILDTYLFNRKNRKTKTIVECMKEVNEDFVALIQETKAFLEYETIEMRRSKRCTTNSRCIYYGSCFDETGLPDDSILYLTTSQHKLEAYANKITHIHELPLSKLDGFRLQYSQYMASKNNPFVDRYAIKAWLDTLEYPLSYLDFEWDTFSIPPYQGMHPFDVLCFQYSLHIETKEGELVEKDFFSDGDCRVAFIESLIKELPSQGSILVYNMEGAEKLRLKQLAVLYPQYKEQLDSICARMKDLSKPFELGLFYDNRQHGHYSLKNVLPVFTNDCSYADLSIQNGLKVMQAYRKYSQANDNEKEKIKQDIREYCKMDTYAEYLILHGLIKEVA